VKSIVRVSCPGCQAQLAVFVEPTQQIQCHKCGVVFHAPQSPAPQSSAPQSPALTPAEKSKHAGIAVGVCVLAGVGFVMSIQPVSLMTGTGTVWMGVVVIGVAVALAFILGAWNWVRVVSIVVLALAVFNGFMVEQEASKRRAEITRTLGR
jgi:hypothetical protein